MLPIVAERRDMVARRADPAPSKVRYRLQRLWLTAWFRSFVRLWLPLGSAALLALVLARDEQVQAWAGHQVDTLRELVASRPELMVREVAIPVGSQDLKRQILGVIDLELPVSALDTDLGLMHDQVQNLRAVKTATVRLRPDGVLEIAVVERMPDMVWRVENRVYLLDETGVTIAEIPRRSTRADLPLVLGQGADKAVDEAAELFSIAAPFMDRVRGLVRVGERRWDVVLKGGQTIMLPEIDAHDALRRVLEMNNTQDILDRDLSVIDLRDPDRPVLRLNDDAIIELRRLRAVVQGEPV